MAEKEHLVGVAVFMDAKSVDDAFEALQWASDFLVLPDGFKLCILDIIKLQEGPKIPVIAKEDLSKDNMAVYWTKIKKRFSGNPEKNIDNFDKSIEKFKNVGVVACEGKDIKQTLEKAIDELNLHMLILGGSIKPNSKCPVVHAKIDLSQARDLD